MEKVRDLYNAKGRFDNWLKKIKNERVRDVSKKNVKLIINFLKDFSLGLNVGNGSKKGSRSYLRLNSLRSRLIVLFRNLEKAHIENIEKTKAIDLHKLFDKMQKGDIRKADGGIYKSTRDYVKTFKTFWHWHQRVMKKKGKLIEDITEDLDARGEKPKFVYFTEEDFQKLVKKASYDIKPVISLTFDAGTRVNELINIRVSDFSNDFKELTIREETSKTFGRKIKLMMCSDQIQKYIKKLDLKTDAYLVQQTPVMINRELRELGKNVLTEEQTKFKNLTLYDFRHSSACFWLPRYKSESALKYRFGWKKSDMIHYYTELLGMKDTITEEDMYIDLTKTEIEKKYKYLKNRMDKVEQILGKIDLSKIL